ncbi:CHAT domain-containing protein [Lentzea alba]|uniref:CHAT domain-containing tetratricopeptide repeat protein n=1 Tax=Lentzea alba TaxID=2714351 RepID=UPI0039BEDDC6
MAEPKADATFWVAIQLAFLECQDVAAVGAMLRELPPPVRAVLPDALEWMVNAAVEAGSPAEAAFLRFVGELASSTDSNVSGFTAALKNAAGRGDLLGQRDALLDGRPLPEDAIDAVLEFADRANLPTYRGYSLATAAGLVSEVDRDRIHGRAMWACALRDRRRYHRAIYHARRAVGEAAAHDTKLRYLTLLTLGSCLQASGNPRGAVDAFLMAEPHAAAADRLTLCRALAMSLRTQGQLHTALIRANNALAEAETQLAGQSNPTLASLLNLRGLIHDDLGRHVAAGADYQAALDIERTHRSGHAFRYRGNLAASLLKRGRIRVGIQVARENVRIAAAQSWVVDGSLHNNLAVAYLTDRDFASAQREYTAALAAYAHRPSGTGAEAISLIGLGDIARDTADHEAARTYYQAAWIHSSEASNGELATMCAARQSEISAEPDSEIVEWLEEDFTAAGRTGHWYRRATAGQTLANLCARGGRRSDAGRLYKLLIAEAEERGNSSFGTQLRLGYARILADQPEMTNERWATVWGCREDFLRQMGATDDPHQRAELAGDALAVYEELIEMLLDHDVPLPDQRSRKELAFDLHEEAKARDLLAELSDGPLPAPAGVQSRLVELEHRCLIARRHLRHTFAVGQRVSPEKVEMGAKIAAHLLAIHDQMGAPEYVRLRAGEPSGLTDIQRLVARNSPAEGMILVSYFVGVRSTFCFVLTSEDLTLQIHRVPIGRDVISSTAAELRRTFNGDAEAFPPMPPLRARRPFARALSFLDALRPLFPWATDLRGLRLACIAPHGPLDSLPIQAMEGLDGVPIGERIAVTHCPSVSVLPYLLAGPPVSPWHALVAAVGATEDSMIEEFESESALLAEVGLQVTELTGTSATPESVLHALSGPEIVHFTCHGISDANDPLESALLLSDGRTRPSRYAAGAGEAGFILRARDIAESPNVPPVAIMRACSASWSMPEHPGAGTAGLTRALLYTGTRTVVGPGWNIDRASSRELVALLYQNWLEGAPLWQALWKAQRALVADDSRPWLRHPYHWASLMILGDWR